MPLVLTEEQLEERRKRLREEALRALRSDAEKERERDWAAQVRFARGFMGIPEPEEEGLPPWEKGDVLLSGGQARDATIPPGAAPRKSSILARGWPDAPQAQAPAPFQWPILTAPSARRRQPLPSGGWRGAPQAPSPAVPRTPPLVDPDAPPWHWPILPMTPKPLGLPTRNPQYRPAKPNLPEPPEPPSPDEPREGRDAGFYGSFVSGFASDDDEMIRYLAKRLYPNGPPETSKILDGDLTLPVKIYLGISSGGMVSYKVKQPMATILETGELIHRRESWQDNITVTGSTKNFALESLTIVNACNASLNSGAGINEKRTFWHAVELELEGHFEMTNGENYPPYSGLRLGLGPGRMPALRDGHRRCG